MERDKVVPLILEGYKEAANEAGSSVSGGIPSFAFNSWYSKRVLWKILGGCVRVENARQLTRHTSDRRLCKALRHRKRTSPGLQLHTTQSCQTVSGQKIIWLNFCYPTLKCEVASNGIIWKTQSVAPNYHEVKTKGFILSQWSCSWTGPFVYNWKDWHTIVFVLPSLISNHQHGSTRCWIENVLCLTFSVDIILPKEQFH